MERMEPKTLTLTDFLLARIAEDEAAASRYSLRNWRAVDGYTVQGDFGVAGRERVDSATDWGICRTAARSDADFIARHDPARVLRECEAKRAAVESAWADHLQIEGEWGRGRDREWLDTHDDVPEVVSVLASVYSDHPDFRDEWSS